MCVCVCVCLAVSVCVCACAHVFLGVCVCVCVQLHVSVCVCARTRACFTLTLFVKLLSAIICSNVCTHIINPKALAAIPSSGPTKILHSVVGMGSAVLVAAVALPRSGDLNVPQGITKY